MSEPIEHVDVRELDLERFEAVLTPAKWREVRAAIDRADTVLAGRTVWNVNSTARGGGVAEMLQSLIGYARGVGVDARWVTIGGDGDFFAVTKRLHNRLHGDPGDGGPLGADEREVYEGTLARTGAALAEIVRKGDIVILHDPQTAGLVADLRDSGAHIAWRSHVGHDSPNELALEGWRFLLPYVREAEVCIFSRRAYAWGGVAPQRLRFIHPSIDVFSVKNQDMTPAGTRAILEACGVFQPDGLGPARFTRAGGAGGVVRRRAELAQDEPLAPDVPLVLQVSRWDRLKDPIGVIDGFARHVTGDFDAHLMVAGPAVAAVSDDPEGADVLAEARERWEKLPGEVRAHVHLATLPMDDPEENAAIVNALQRHATVVCQKSIAEGFGLTVAEAMWKSRPLVASRVGGIQDQVQDGVSGLLLDDPHDLPDFGRKVGTLLGEPDRAALVGECAHLRAREEFLGPHHLIRYLELFEELI